MHLDQTNIEAAVRRGVSAYYGVVMYQIGPSDLRQLTSTLVQSSRAGGPMDGLVVPRELGGRMVGRAKRVNAAFTQAIDAQRTKGALIRNDLAPTGA